MKPHDMDALKKRAEKVIAEKVREFPVCDHPECLKGPATGQSLYSHGDAPGAYCHAHYPDHAAKQVTK